MMAPSEMRVAVTDVVMSLAAGRTRRFQIRPPLHDLPRCDSPNHNPPKFRFLPGLCIRSCPVIPHYHAIIFRNHVFDRHTQIWEFLQRPADIRDRTRRPRRHSRRHIRSIIYKIGREIHVPDLYVFPVHEFFKMIADKFPRFAVRHSRFRVYRSPPSAL